MSRFEISVLVTLLGLIFTGVLFYRQFMSVAFAGQAGMPLNEVVPNILSYAVFAAMALFMCVVGASLQGKVIFTLLFALFVSLTLIPFFVEYVFEFNRTAAFSLLSIISYFLSVICFFFISNKSQKERET